MSKAEQPRYLHGPALRRERLAAGISQAELARRIGALQGQVSGWERGHTGCRIETLHELATALGIPPSRIARPSLIKAGTFRAESAAA